MSLLALLLAAAPLRAQAPAMGALQSAGSGSSQTAQVLDGSPAAPPLAVPDVPLGRPLLAAAVSDPVSVVAVSPSSNLPASTQPAAAPGVAVPSKIVDAILLGAVGAVVGGFIGSLFGMPALLFGATIGAGLLSYLGFELGKAEDKATEKK
jgi:hypothetical protein